MILPVNQIAHRVYPDGRVETFEKTPAQSAKEDAMFLRDFDPLTLERRSIQRHRHASERKSPPPSAAGQGGAL